LEDKHLDKISLDTDVAAILARLDRSSSDALLNSIAGELLRLHRAFDHVVARMHALEITQTIQDKIAAAHDASAFAALPTTVVIEASFTLPADSGFYQLEYDGRGTPFRWTGPDPAFFFEVFIDRTARASLRMHYIQVLVRDSQNSIACYVDGELIETTLTEVPNGYEIQGTLPARDTVGGTVVTFVCPGVSTPASFGNSPDTRQLGLAFRWLRIDPESIFSTEHEHTDEVVAAVSRDAKKMPSGKLRRRVSSAGHRSR
jgi:hypothetical protein